MSTFGDRVKKLREERNLSLRQLAKLTGISHSAISAYENGRREPSYESLESLADVFNCDIGYLLGRTDIKNAAAYELGSNSFFDSINLQLFAETLPIKKKILPILGNVACGEPIYADEDRSTYVSVDDDMDADFCLVAKGDSMINARIFDGDLLFVKRCDTVDDGQIAVVLIEDEATVKRVYVDREDGTVTLMPENPTHRPMRYKGEQLESIRILGLVVSGQYVVR